MESALTEAPGLAAFVDTLRERRLFDPGEPVAVARAPGRLDVMGGIADYSGSLVLERPIAEATTTRTPDVNGRRRSRARTSTTPAMYAAQRYALSSNSRRASA